MRLLRAQAAVVAVAACALSACGALPGGGGDPGPPSSRPSPAQSSPAQSSTSPSSAPGNELSAEPRASRSATGGSGAAEPTGADPAESQPAETQSASPDLSGLDPSEPSDSQPSSSELPPEPAAPPAMMSRGDRGDRVRELQHRLLQLDWFTGPVTGSYATSTVEAVSGFQEKRSLRRTGEVDRGTWITLVSMTTMPTPDQLFNRLRPGPALLRQGSTGDRVRDLQARLKQIGWHVGPVSDSYGPVTVANLKGFQGKRGIPVTGEVDQRTWDRLAAMTRTPTKAEKHNTVPKPAATRLDPRCLTDRALCISKATNQLVWVVDGEAQLQLDVRFGSDELPTREGAFLVGWKSRNHVSTIYHTPMPFAMFFSGGQAVHYSPDFAAHGYNGASHGCVNVRDRQAIEHLFDTVRVGDKVIVYR